MTAKLTAEILDAQIEKLDRELSAGRMFIYLFASFFISLSVGITIFSGWLFTLNVRAGEILLSVVDVGLMATGAGFVFLFYFIIKCVSKDKSL